MSIQVFDHLLNHFLLAFKKNNNGPSDPLEKHRKNRSATTLSNASNSHYFLIMTLALFVSIILALMLIVLFYSMEL
jgi:hypothetical protein